MRWWVVHCALGLFFGIGWGGIVQAGESGDELDGALAPPSRWSGPGGNPSGNGRSAAAPLVTEIERAWKLELGEVLAPPVLWDGLGFVVAEGPRLVAFDLRTGKTLATKKLKGFQAGAGLHITEGVVFLEIQPGTIHAYRLSGKTIKNVWLFRGMRIGGDMRYPGRWVVHDYELYAYFEGYLARVKPGTRWPLWAVPIPPNPQGAPAILGNHVFSCQVSNGPRVFLQGSKTRAQEHGLSVQAYRRSTGKRDARFHTNVYSNESNRTPPQLTVTEKRIFIRLAHKVIAEKGSKSDLCVQLQISKGRVKISEPLYLWDFVQPPAQHSSGTVAMTGEKGARKWSLIQGDKVYYLAEEAKQPDLFRDGVRPTVLGDILYFGSWAVDIDTREILWRLPIRRAAFPAVPADGMVLVVENGVLHAFRGRETR